MHRCQRQQGVTLIELTIIMIVIGVLGAIGLLRYQPAESGVGYQADRLMRDIRHMQMLAITWGMTLRLVPVASGYSVRCASGSATAPCNGAGTVTDPADGQPFQYSPLENGVTLAGSNLDIDSLGRPVSGGALITAANPSFTLTTGTGKVSTVTVQRLTGYVTVVY
jgi:type II secretory pathway pseudopilin PulG